MSLNIWTSRVKYEYEKINKTRNTQIKNAWQENWKKCNLEEEDALDRPQIKWLSKPVADKNRKVKAISKKPPIHLLNQCEPLPRMLNWVITPRSSLAKNESVLFNLPFISHKRNKTGEKFLKNLLKSYGGRLSGAERFSTLKDEVLVELVEALQFKYTPLQHYRLPPNPKFFEAISVYFSNIASPEDLQKKYLELTCHEGSDAAQSPTNSCEHALQAIKKYFCRRCYMYNCDLHRAEQTIASSNQTKRNSTFCIKTPVGPCGSDCFKLLKIAGKAEKMQTKSEENSQGARGSIEIPSSTAHIARLANIEPEGGTVTLQQDWSDDDKSFFQVLHKMFPNNYCIIAQIMLIKTCQQVFEFAQSGTDSVRTKELCQTRLSSQRRKLPKTYKHWAFYKLREQAQKDQSSMKMHNYFPCNHPGKSCGKDCSCIKLQNACEKFCHCSPNCSNRFRGCNCTGQCNTKKCPCFAFTRECDADLCRKCGAAEYDICKVECKNVSIQRGLCKHLLLAPSDVAGWGIFLKDSAQKHDFISEYVGEIISQEEADRRGKVYDKQKSSFLFELNVNFVVDATNMGGKIRFANHSINPNCYAKVMMVLGNHRIGIFAQRDILPGEELFFDYRYNLTEQLKFVSIEREMETV